MQLFHSKTNSRQEKSNNAFVQAKSIINNGADACEQEADAMAERVTRSSTLLSPVNNFFRPVETPVQRKEGMEASGEIENYIGSLSSKGRPLSNTEKGFFEPAFGHDFSNVRLHTDSEAGASAKSINAKAYTASNNIVFGPGQYQPGSSEGNRLLAHELTHVVQQQQAQQAIQRERELNADESKDCFAKIDAAIAALEKSAADENEKLPDYIKEAIKVLREKRTAGKIKCYAFEGIKHGRVDLAKDEIQYDGVNADWINETSVLHEAVHALHSKQYSTSAKKYAKAQGEGKKIGENAKDSDVDLLRWKAWTEYWAYRSSKEYYNDKQQKTDDEIHKAVMEIHEVIVAVNNVRQFDPGFDPRTWKPK